MVLMALDHVRVFSGIPAGAPMPALFFTRWITHFCAPAFIFLAGSSAYFYGRRHGGLPRFLLTRGLWLILLELTFLRVAWTFNVGFDTYQMLGVIWVIGLCMIAMAALVKLPVRWIAALGLVIIFGHNLVDPYLDSLIPALGGSQFSGFWKVIYLGFWSGPIRPGGGSLSIWVLYSFIPWIGVMAAGFSFGAVLGLNPDQRDRICLRIGLGTLALFIVLRGFALYGDPRPWTAIVEGDGFGPKLPVLLAIISTTKYPASLNFLLMTLGPTIFIIPTLERAGGLASRWLTIFGRVPFFYYMVHIPLIHLLAIAVSIIQLGDVSPWLFANHPMGAPDVPEGYTWSLPVLYSVWMVAVVLLYHASRWFAAVKATRHDWWLSYL